MFLKNNLLRRTSFLNSRYLSCSYTSLPREEHVTRAIDDDLETEGSEYVYLWKNGRRVKVASTNLLTAEEDKKLWEAASRAHELAEAQKIKREAVDAAQAAKVEVLRMQREVEAEEVKRDEMVIPDLGAAKPVYQPPTPGPVSKYADIRQGGLTIKKADFTVNSLMDKIRRGKLDLRPSYQREYVWDNKTASKLIESILINVPIPTLFFHEVQMGCLEVVDGKQRLTSIWSYIQQEFPDLEPFRLSGLEVYEELNGSCFNDLSDYQQETIKDYAINVHIIAHQSQPEFVFEVFERLNMGSTQLNEQELRNCIYQGEYTDLLERLTHSTTMQAALRVQEPHIRMKDRELILRFFAMYHSTPTNFFSPVKSWLNAEMRERKHMSRTQADEMEAIFSSTLESAWVVFGDSAFRPIDKKSRSASTQLHFGEINQSLWDTVMFSFSQQDPVLLKKHKEKIAASFYELLGDPKFARLLTSTPKAVVVRHETWESRLLPILKKK